MCPYASAVLCDDGTCVGRNIWTGLSMCKSDMHPPLITRPSHFCPVTSPYLCSDYSCASHPFSCPMVAPCPEGYHHCDDGTCSPLPCGPVTQRVCPMSRPVRCDSGLCVKTPLDCEDVHKCPRRSDCLFSFPSSASDTCFDGSCVSSYFLCPHLNCTSLALALNLMFPLHQCWNGDCLAPGSCPPLPSCPQGSPVRCSDGSCRETPEQCNAVLLERGNRGNSL